MAIASWLRQDVSKKDIAPSLMELLNLILHKTNFTINGEHYLQEGGTSMETPCAPSFALKNYPFKPSYNFRYIDDICFLWTHGEDKLHQCLEYMNG